MVTKIEIQHQGRTVWTKEDDNILDPKDISIKFDNGAGHIFIFGTVQDIVTNDECPTCGYTEN